MFIYTTKKWLCHVTFFATALMLWSTPGAQAQTAVEGTHETATVPKPELTLQFGHSGYVNSVDFSPDGKLLASGGADGLVKLWDAKTGEAIRTLTTMTHQQWIYGVRFSPDGKILASSYGDLWDVRSGKLLRTLPYGSMSVGFSVDGKIIAVNSSLYDVESGKLLRNLSGPTGDGERKHLQFFEVAFSPDGKTLAGAVTDRTLRLWDVETGALLKTLQRDLYVKAVVYTTDGKSVIGACGDNTLKIWDTASGEVVRTIIGHTREVSSVVYSRDRKLLASGSEDGTIRLWQVDAAGLPAQNPMRIFDRVSGVREVAIAPDHKTIAGTSPFDIVWWDMETGEMKRRQRTFNSQVHSLAFRLAGVLS